MQSLFIGLYKLRACKVAERYADFFRSNQHFYTYNYVISYLNFPLVKFSKFSSRFVGTYKQIGKAKYKTNF